MAPEPHLPVPGHPQNGAPLDQAAAAGPAEERKTMAGPRRSSRQPRPPGLLDAGPLEPDIASFRLHLAAEGKSARTVQGYTVRGALVRRRLPAQPGRKDQLGPGGRPRHPAVDGAPAGPVQQRVRQHPVPGAAAVLQVAGRRGRLPRPDDPAAGAQGGGAAKSRFSPAENYRNCQKACQGRSFAARRDAAIIAVFTATGIRLSELAGICCHPGDPARSDLDLHGREIRIRGKGGTARTVKIGHQAARSLDRYLRARARHPQAWRPQLWLGVNSRGPLTAAGIYQAVARRGRQCRGDRVPAPVPAPLQPHLAGPRRSRTRPDGTQRLDLPADAHPVRRQRPRRPRPPQLRPHHGRQHLTPPRKTPPGSTP